MTVQWFWRPEALQEHRIDEAGTRAEKDAGDSSDEEIDIRPVEAGHHEVFLSTCEDTHNSIDSIER